MVKGINLEEVKKYNEALRQYKDRASKLVAEIEFHNKELMRICQELTQELGVEVTPNNLEQLYNEYVEKISNTLQTGKEILRRIKEQEENLNSTEKAYQQITQQRQRFSTSVQNGNNSLEGINIGGAIKLDLGNDNDDLGLFSDIDSGEDIFKI